MYHTSHIHRRLSSVYRVIPLYIALLLLYLAIIVSGCPHRDALKPTTNPTTQPSSSGLQQVVAEIRQNRARIHSLEGHARLRMYRPDGKRVTHRLSYYIQRPDRINLQAVVAMQPILIATSDGQRFALHNLSQREFIHGPSEALPKLLGDFIPEQLPLRDLVSILFGEIPIFNAKNWQHLSSDQPNIANFDFKSSTHSQSLWIDLTGKFFIKTQLKYRDKPPLLLEYGTYRGNPPLPSRIQFVNLQTKERVHWIFSRTNINPKLSIKHFQQDPPKGVKIQEVY